MSFFKGSTDFPDAEKPAMPEEEQAILKKVATKVVERRMAVPAIVFLESVKPLNFIGSQVLIFFEPIIQPREIKIVSASFVIDSSILNPKLHRE